MDYSLEKLFGCFFLNWVLIRHLIFWEINHFENSKRMELRKKENSISKGKGKERRE